MSTQQTVPLEPDCRIQIPVDWVEALGLSGLVTLERTDHGILVRPGPRQNGASQAQLLADLKRRSLPARTDFVPALQLGPIIKPTPPGTAHKPAQDPPPRANGHAPRHS